MQLIMNVNEGDQVEVYFNLSSREWNGKWFTSADAWKIEKIQADIDELEIVIDNSEIPVFENNQTEEDDLPF